MKKDLENIDEIFRDAFDGFESNVDPSVWSNVQNAVNGAKPLPNTSTTLTNGIAKATFFKIAAAAAIVGSTIGSIYYYNNSESTSAVVENTPAPTPNPEPKKELQHITNSNKDDSDDSEIKNNIPKPIVKTEKTISSNTTEDITLVNDKKESTKETIKGNNESNKITQENPTKTEQDQPKAKEKVVLFANIIASQTKGTAPLDVEFNIDGNGVSYQWDFDDNSSVSGERTPYHTFEKAGTYQVSLTTIDNEANSKSTYLTIEVEKNITSSLGDIPNVFTPNGDGKNDILKIEGNDIQEFKASVLNSKGELIFEWNSIEGFWDGRDQGNNLVPKGSYFISIIAIGNDGEQYTPKKTIQLF